MRTLDLNELRDGLKPALPRKALLMEAEVFGRTAAVVSVHLDHGAAPEVRLAQAEKLVRNLEERPANRADYIVLAGDFNDADDSPTIRFLLSSGYRDAYRACHNDAGNTYPAGNPTARIDYILVKGTAEIRSSGLLLNDPDLSDHIGVFAEIA
jgi:endonuclease/exonuclease/phosphatase family metal-dependent hydrolase